MNSSATPTTREAQFDLFYQQHGRLRAFILHHVTDPEAMDIEQQTYLLILQALPKMDSRVFSYPYPYARRVAKNLIVDRIRRAYRHTVLTFSEIEEKAGGDLHQEGNESEPYAESLISPNCSIEETIERRIKLAEALALLPRDWQQECALRDAGLKGEEIARLRGEKYTAYKTRRYRLYTGLQESLAAVAAAWE